MPAKRKRRHRRPRLAEAAAWAAAVIVVVVLLATPLRRVHVMIRLRFQELRAPLQVPVAGVAARHLTDTWGGMRSGGRRHEGIDIFAECGRPILSATEGVVLNRGEDGLGGQVIRVYGPAGTSHYYAHLSRFAEPDAGDHVLPGDVIGYVGDTGNARGTPCHLHYGIYRDGVAENPYPYLAPARTTGSTR